MECNSSQQDAIPKWRHCAVSRRRVQESFKDDGESWCGGRSVGDTLKIIFTKVQILIGHAFASSSATLLASSSIILPTSARMSTAILYESQSCDIFLATIQPSCHKSSPLSSVTCDLKKMINCDILLNNIRRWFWFEFASRKSEGPRRDPDCWQVIAIWGNISQFRRPLHDISP